MNVLKLLIFLQFVGVIMCPNANLGSIEKKILDQIFSTANYDKRISPRQNSTDLSSLLPVNVTASMYIRSLTFIDESKEIYGIEISFRLEWVDDRLKFDDANKRLPYLTLNAAGLIWTPNLYFSDRVKGYLHMITTPNSLARIYPDGKVLLSQRFNLEIGTNFNYQMYPFDQQKLGLYVRSKFTDLTLRWLSYSAVSTNKNINLPLFTVETIETITKSGCCNIRVYPPYLELQISVSRDIFYYLFQVFIPCNLFVIAGYLSFWLDIKFLTGRVFLSTSTLYTLASLINTLNSEIPKVSYPTFIDYYSGMCLTFVFASLIELVIAQAFENNTCKNQSNGESDQQVQSFNVKNMKQWLKSTPLNKVDAIFRIAYPIAFIACLIIYILVACILKFLAF